MRAEQLGMMFDLVTSLQDTPFSPLFSPHAALQMENRIIGISVKK